jgi:hypothetical protein
MRSDIVSRRTQDEAMQAPWDDNSGLSCTSDASMSIEGARHASFAALGVVGHV